MWEQRLRLRLRRTGCRDLDFEILDFGFVEDDTREANSKSNQKSGLP